MYLNKRGLKQQPQADLGSFTQVGFCFFSGYIPRLYVIQLLPLFSGNACFVYLFGGVCDLKMILGVCSTWERFLSCVRQENVWVVCWRPKKDWFWPFFRFEKNLFFFPSLDGFWIGNVHNLWKIFIRVFDLAKTFHSLFGLGKSLVLCSIFCCYIFCWAFFPFPPLPWPEGKSTVLPITRLRMVSWSGRASGCYPSFLICFPFRCFVLSLLYTYVR